MGKPVGTMAYGRRFRSNQEMKASHHECCSAGIGGRMCKCAKGARRKTQHGTRNSTSNTYATKRPRTMMPNPTPTSITVMPITSKNDGCLAGVETEWGGVRR